MVKQREMGFVRIINEPAKSRIENNECPSCGKPKHKWTRRSSWRCCSVECTTRFESFCIIRTWSELRSRAFKRDNYTCIKCGKKPKARRYDSKLKEDGSYEYFWVDTDEPNDSELIGDHIKPIALGGDQWDIDNIQTLCVECNKVKTAEDIFKIAKLRNIEKKQSNGQKQLNEVKQK